MATAIPPEKCDPSRMRAMFGSIAPRYDFVTRVFSYGMDAGWKREAVLGAGLTANARVLDLACGTGDFSRLVDGRAVAADLTYEMVDSARRGGIERAVCADALRLPFPARAFDAVFVGYGVRNFPDLRGALCEIARVLREGGKLVTLDFFLPRAAGWRKLYLAWLYVQGGAWGLALHGHPRTYTYIPDSLRSFQSAEAFAGVLRECGFARIAMQRHIGGGIAIHWATRTSVVPPR